MTFETEELNIQDYECEKYPIYDIASPNWNPREHFDDTYGIDINIHHTECHPDKTDRLTASIVDGDTSSLPELVARSNESITSNIIPSLLDNSIQQDEFDQSPFVGVCSIADERKDNTLDSIKIPWDIETCYKDNDELSTLSLMEINLDDFDPDLQMTFTSDGFYPDKDNLVMDDPNTMEHNKCGTNKETYYIRSSSLGRSE